ncbi:MAG TPA: hypothetical protein VGP44_07245, partial [Gemmatimonadales bacterium]|nr:hypothetical protein [Gemmatimonadales bacterium]
MNGSLTPGREVEIILDHSEEIQVEPFFSVSRDRFEIRQPVLSNVIQLQSGTWILKPINDIDQAHESTDGQSGTLRLSAFNAAGCVREIARQRTFTELTGLSPSGAVASSGDYWMVKRVAAGASWNQEISYSLGKPTLPSTAHYPMDRLIEHNTTLIDALTSFTDTGYLLRWQAPGSSADLADYLFTFYFGGELAGQPFAPHTGFGLFALTVTGYGRAILFERIDNAWEQVAEWQYAAASQVPGKGMTMRLIPHSGRYLEIKTEINDRAEPNLVLNQTRMDAWSGRTIAADTFTYETKNRVGMTVAQNNRYPPVTGGQYVAMDVRRDLRLTWQINRLLYPASGTLTDQPFVVPYEPDVTAHALEIVPHGYTSSIVMGILPATAIVIQPQHATTGASLSTKTETYSFRSQTRTINGWLLPGAPNAVKVRFTLQNLGGAGTPFTPFFMGYEARKRGTQETPATTPFLINGTHNRQSPCTQLSITGQDADPSHATASMTVEDLTNRASRLRTRSE